ncbi:hypothetical protein D1007_24427 [Hordeum vulgare]|nr:hypothetical protein D1007_24427 [Hordeum vulgare]
MLNRLNLTTQESTAFVLEEDDEKYPDCPTWALVGKVLSPNTLHISTIKAVLKPAWGNPRGLECHPLGANKFLAEFGSKADKDRKREVTDVYQVKYERLPLFCFSCGCVGHSSVVCPMLGERDPEGLLPYHSSRLCVPDDKKKKPSGAKSGQSSYSKNTTPGPSDGVHAPNNATSRARGKETAGEGNPTLKQRKPRANRAKINASKDVNKLILDGTAGSTGSGKLAHISGQKRKVYQPKVQVPQEEQDTSPLPMILVSSKGTQAADHTTTTEDGQLPAVENNKKRKTSTTTRSTDQAEAAVEPC